MGEISPSQIPKETFPFSLHPNHTVLGYGFIPNDKPRANAVVVMAKTTELNGRVVNTEGLPMKKHFCPCWRLIRLLAKFPDEIDFAFVNDRYRPKNQIPMKTDSIL